MSCRRVKSKFCETIRARVDVLDIIDNYFDLGMSFSLYSHHHGRSNSLPHQSIFFLVDSVRTNVLEPSYSRIVPTHPRCVVVFLPMMIEWSVC